MFKRERSHAVRPLPPVGSLPHAKLLRVNGVLVRCFDLDDATPDAVLEATLSADERARAASFRFPIHRHRFVRCRALLRQQLAGALNIDAASIVFCYGPQGKPETDGVHFNVSHSDHLAVIAIARDHPIGVDLERIDDTKDVLSLARVAFSPVECDALASLPPADQIPVFYQTWARKEAYLKLLGTGFSLPSDSFTLSTLTDCVLEDLDVHPGFACALAKPA